MITDLRPSHTNAEFVKFLNKINREVPKELDVHVVLDNLSTHKTPQVQQWLLRSGQSHGILIGMTAAAYFPKELR